MEKGQTVFIIKNMHGAKILENTINRHVNNRVFLYAEGSYRDRGLRLGRDAFETMEEAIVGAEKRRDGQIEQLKKEINKLESLDFRGTNLPSKNNIRSAVVQKLLRETPWYINLKVDVITWLLIRGIIKIKKTTTDENNI